MKLNRYDVEREDDGYLVIMEVKFPDKANGGCKASFDAASKWANACMKTLPVTAAPPPAKKKKRKSPSSKPNPKGVPRIKSRKTPRIKSRKTLRTKGVPRIKSRKTSNTVPSKPKNR